MVSIENQVKTLFTQAVQNRMAQLAAKIRDFRVSDIHLELAQHMEDFPWEERNGITPEWLRAEAQKLLDDPERNKHVYTELREGLEDLTPNDFKINWKFGQKDLDLVGKIVTENTNKQVIDTQGACKIWVPDRTDNLGHSDLLITFSDERELTSAQKYAVIRVADKFRSDMQRPPKGFLSPAGFMGQAYGVFSAYNIEQLITSINYGLGEFQLPMTHWQRLDLEKIKEIYETGEHAKSWTERSGKRTGMVRGEAA
jgi:hypothetical protein